MYILVQITVTRKERVLIKERALSPLQNGPNSDFSPFFL